MQKFVVIDTDRDGIVLYNRLGFFLGRGARPKSLSEKSFLDMGPYMMVGKKQTTDM